jgi:hypothetical protein
MASTASASHVLVATTRRRARSGDKTASAHANICVTNNLFGRRVQWGGPGLEKVKDAAPDPNRLEERVAAVAIACDAEVPENPGTGGAAVVGGQASTGGRPSGGTSSGGKAIGGSASPPDIWNLPAFPVATGPFTADWSALGQAYSTPQWWRDAKLGAWAHWDPQSMPEQGDWYAYHMYRQGTAQYNYHVSTFGDPSE